MSYSEWMPEPRILNLNESNKNFDFPERRKRNINSAEILETESSILDLVVRRNYRNIITIATKQYLQSFLSVFKKH